jgi:hypothetical protein
MAFKIQVLTTDRLKIVAGLKPVNRIPVLCRITTIF